METCVFCEKFAKIEDRVIAFEPLNPVVEGHLLVVPREHVKDFAEDSEVTARVMRYVALLAQGMNGDYNLITSKGKSATQSVFHMHVHLVPRSEGDGLKLPWTDQETLQAKK